MAGTVGELAIELGVNGDVKKLEAFVKQAQKLAKNFNVAVKVQDKHNESLTKTIKKIRNLGIAISATIFAVEKLTDSLIKDNQVWLNFRNQTDLSLKTLQGYAGVASLFDKSLGMQGAAGTIQALNDRLFELQLTGEGAKGFQIAGINPIGQNAFGVLEQLRDRIQKGNMSDTAATYMLRQLGLDPKLLPMLKMERSEFEELRRIEERLTLTEEERSQILALQMRREIAHQKLRLAQQRLALALLPLWTKLTEIAGTLAEGLAKLTKRFNELNSGLKAIVVGFVGWLVGSKMLNAFMSSKFLKTALKLLGVTNKFKFNLKDIATKAIPMIKTAFASLLRIVTRIFLPLLSLYLILEDIFVWLSGGDSLIGTYYNLAKNWQENQTPNIDLNRSIDVKNPNNPAAIRAKEQLERQAAYQRMLDEQQNQWWVKAFDFAGRAVTGKSALEDLRYGYGATGQLDPTLERELNKYIKQESQNKTINVTQNNNFAPGTAPKAADDRLEFIQQSIGDVHN